MIYEKYQEDAMGADKDKRIDAEYYFQVDLAAEYLPEMHEKVVAEVFNCAWEFGHSYGLDAVESYYMDMAQIALEAKARYDV